MTYFTQFALTQVESTNPYSKALKPKAPCFTVKPDAKTLKILQDN